MIDPIERHFSFLLLLSFENSPFKQVTDASKARRWYNQICSMMNERPMLYRPDEAIWELIDGI